MSVHSDNTDYDKDSGEERQTIVDFGGPACIIVAILTMNFMAFQRNENIYIIPALILALIGLIWGFNSKGKIMDGTSAALAVLFVVLLGIYGITKIDFDGHTISHPTVLACGTDTELDEESNTHPILRTPQGSFNIEAGEYYNLKDNTLHRVFAVTPEQAAKQFVPGHAYRLTVDNYRGESYDGITTAKEVPNTLGACNS